MRRSRWLKLQKAYDMKVKYHPRKANVVVDSLSRKSIDSMASPLTIQRRLLRELDALQIEIMPPRNKNYMATLQATSLQIETKISHFKKT